MYEARRKTFRDVLDDRFAALTTRMKWVQAEVERAMATVQPYRARSGNLPPLSVALRRSDGKTGETR
ncbi:MAG: hypothetical protein WB402_07335 [Sulfuricaulis sp.]|uniref:hypothetical protein n=1 Tax=Sulfuricaulis sp. TaxID=2003553 RepID=UPI003C452D91